MDSLKTDTDNFYSPAGTVPSSENALMRAFKSVSDETRVRILHILSYADFSVNEIVEILSMGQSSVSRHLKILTDAGLLSARREGSWVYYSIRNAGKYFSYDLTQLVLSYKEDLPFREIDQKNVNLSLQNRESLSQEFFDDLGQNWEKVQEEVLDPKIYRDRILSSLPANSDLVLDLGCGPGGLIPYLLSKSNKILGLDSSSKMVEVAKKEFQGNPRVDIQQAHLEQIPVSDGSSDSVVASMVLHHVSHPPKILEEINRALKLGGTFCLVDLVKHNQEFMREKYADLWMGFEPELIQSWLRSYGFELIEQDSISTNTVFKILFIKATKKEDLHVRNSN
ncbi:MAG: metalloregulator ArsR/SmtB family transcription factor [Leptospira sp.]|jgi:ubiquinone/menaquinone biosynthesis C-methylase UbiE/predicted transcriptional regulator|nr:metalloregulator ArsR/SmtB family transcription factor [Leptospira sp.]NCS95582.1 metalloregulator ArsR/SmtB family transcription factor [Leptospira sp.]